MSSSNRRPLFSRPLAATRFLLPTLAAVASLLLTASMVSAETVVAIEGATSPQSLEQCVEAVLKTNGTLRAERQRVTELEAQITQARSEGLPTLDLSGSWVRSRDPSFALDETFIGGEENDAKGLRSQGEEEPSSGFDLTPEDIVAQSFWRASVNAAWQLRPQRIWNAVQGANIAVDRQEVILSGIEQTVVEDVLRTYYDVLLAAEELRALESELETRQEFLEISKRRFRVELGTELDTLQARVALANAQPEQRRAAQNLRSAGSRLNILLGKDPLSPLEIESTYPIESIALDPDVVRRLVEERADVRERALEVNVLRKARGAQKSLHRPYLSLDGSYGYVGKDIPSLTDAGHESWSARVALTVPLFDGLLTRGRVQETEAGIRRTEQERDELVREALLETWQVYGDLGAAEQTLGAAELNLAAATEVLRRTTLRYELGKGENLEVLNAQLDQFRARSILIRARHEVLTLTASLKRALGFDPSRAWSELPLR